MMSSISHSCSQSGSRSGSLQSSATGSFLPSTEACALGAQLTPAQWAQLTEQPGRSVYIAFDQDDNQAGQKASHQLALRLENAGLPAHIVQLPDGLDPNSYFVAGARAADFTAQLQKADRL